MAGEDKHSKKHPASAKKKDLKKKGMQQVNRFRYKDAIETGKPLIEADPEEATGYFVLGAALQETGRWKDGAEQFNECVRKATKGPVNDCKAAGGRK